MAQIIDKSDILKLSVDKLDKWLELNYENLIGSAIFTKNNSLGSKLVRWGEKHLFAKCKSADCFVPSHTGSIIAKNPKPYKEASPRTTNLYIFDMKPPKASIQLLADYLLNTDEDYKLILRDFGLNTTAFCINCLDHVGEFYPYLSALRSVFTKRQSKWLRHCSEFHLRELQKQGLYTEVNPEITPDELYHLLKGDE